MSFLFHYLQLKCNLWLQRDAVDRLALALISHVSINLSGFHVLVSEHVLDGIDTCSCINLQGAESMTGAVEGDVLGDTSSLQPVLQGGARHLVLEVGEDFCIGFVSSVIEANEFKGLLADRVVHKLLSLLHTYSDIHTSISVWLNLLPCQRLDVALSESRQTREEEGFLQYRFLAVCIGKFYEFRLREVFLLRRDGVNPVKEAIGILLDFMVTVGCMEHGTEG